MDTLISGKSHGPSTTCALSPPEFEVQGMLFCVTTEGQEGRNAHVERRTPDFARFPRRP